MKTTYFQAKGFFLDHKNIVFLTRALKRMHTADYKNLQSNFGSGPFWLSQKLYLHLIAENDTIHINFVITKQHLSSSLLFCRAGRSRQLLLHLAQNQTNSFIYSEVAESNLPVYIRHFFQIFKFQTYILGYYSKYVSLNHTSEYIKTFF